MIVVPKADPGFADHPCHGELAQHRFLRAVLPYVKQWRMAVDVGAHVGLWTRMLASKFSHVTAFEPVAENFACLQQNVTLPNVVLENAALGAAPGLCAMALPPDGNSGCWRVEPDGREIELKTLDSYRLNEVDLIKVDVEGFEGEVLRGARETLQRWRPTVVLEENGLGHKFYEGRWFDPGPSLVGLRYRRAGTYAKNEVWIPY